MGIEKRIFARSTNKAADWIISLLLEYGRLHRYMLLCRFPKNSPVFVLPGREKGTKKWNKWAMDNSQRALGTKPFPLDTMEENSQYRRNKRELRGPENIGNILEKSSERETEWIRNGGPPVEEWNLWEGTHWKSVNWKSREILKRKVENGGGDDSKDHYGCWNEDAASSAIVVYHWSEQSVRKDKTDYSC